MKLRILMAAMTVLALTSCKNSPDYPARIPKSETFEAPSELISALGVVGIFGHAYHLEDGFTKEKGKTLLCRSEAKQHTVVFYAPDESGYVRVGSPVHFGDKQPHLTVHNERPAMKGRYKGKDRFAYIDAGKVVVRDQ